MTEQRASNRILTIPNLVSFIRIGGVGLFWWVLLAPEEPDIALAAILIFAIGWTDWIDGYLARRLNQVSELGKALDPVADRLMIGSAVVGGLIVGVVPAVIGLPLILRELFVGVIAVYLFARGAGTIEVRQLGKYATFIIYGSIPSFYLAAAGVVPWLFGPAAWLSGVAGLVMYWLVALRYVGDARLALSQLESEAESEEG